MSRTIEISKYKDNTHYSVRVVDGFGQEHHLGLLGITLEMAEIDDKAHYIWNNEVKQEVSSMDKAIAECVKMDIDRGVEPILD